MRKLLFVLTLWCTWENSILGGAPPIQVTKWTSPSGSTSIRLIENPQKPDLQKDFSFVIDRNGKEIPVVKSPLIQGDRRHEFHGMFWFTSATSKWCDERYLILVDKNLAGLAVLDSETGIMLLNNFFEVCSPAPTNKCLWAAIRYRATGRQQEMLDVTYRDELLLLDPRGMAKGHQVAAKEGEDHQLAHISSAVVEGIALSAPVWRLADDVVTVLVWHSGTSKVVEFGIAPFKAIKATPIDFKVTEEEAMSLKSYPALTERATRTLKNFKNQ